VVSVNKSWGRINWLWGKIFVLLKNICQQKQKGLPFARSFPAVLKIDLNKIKINAIL
jgi:hypothetical protein